MLAAPAVWLLISGCQPATSARRLTLVHRGWPLTLTPHLVSEVVTLSVQSNIYEALVALTPEMELRPQLAEAWECPNDSTWILRLRRGVRFHNGDQLTAEDVVYSLERARRHPGSVLQANFADVVKIEPIGELGIKITTGRPCPSLPNKLTNIFIVPARVMESLGESRDAIFSRHPVGTGPYCFASFSESGPLLLKRWSGYWGQRPKYSQIAIWGCWQPDSSLAMLLSGRADIVTQLEAEAVVRWKTGQDTGYDIVSRPGLMLRYLGFNFRNRKFRDVRIRRAVSLAVDRREIVDSIYFGYGVPANQLVTPGIFGYHPGLPPLEYDPRRARQLLQQAGYPRGLGLTLTLPDARQSLGRLLQRQMARAGIRLSLRILSREEFFSAVDTASLFLMGASSLSTDAGDLYQDAIHSRGRGFGATNRGGYANPQLDSLIESVFTIFDSRERLSRLQEIMALAMEDMPRVPLLVADDIYGVSRRVQWKPRVDLMVLGKEARPKVRAEPGLVF